MTQIERPLEITSLSKSWGDYTAVKGFNVRIEPGEFVCLLGHSGCGKSTVLSIIAGLDIATEGGVCIDGREIDSPGTDRGVVFQSPSLLPWLSALDNVRLAAAQVFPKYSRAELKKHAMKYMAMTGVDDVASGSPADLSLGTQQRIAIARALSLEPRFLLLDEPFGMLDTLTRFDLQDTLLAAWEKSRKTVVMVTHDIDEALYLADRIVLMTDGPASYAGEIIGVPFERPRDRAQMLKRSDYHGLRNRVLDFLENHANHGKVA